MLVQLVLRTQHLLALAVVDLKKELEKLYKSDCSLVYLAFNVPPTAKGHMETGPQFIAASDRLEGPRIKPVKEKQRFY